MFQYCNIIFFLCVCEYISIQVAENRLSESTDLITIGRVSKAEYLTML